MAIASSLTGDKQFQSWMSGDFGRHPGLFSSRLVADADEKGRAEEPWLMIIPCIRNRGHIFPWGGTLLAASVDKRGLIRPLMKIASCRIVQDAYDGATITFEQADFAKVARVMKPRRRKQISEEERKRLAELSRRHGFKPGHISKRWHSDEKTPFEGQTDSQAPGDLRAAKVDLPGVCV